jgi:hypothetical protein
MQCTLLCWLNWMCATAFEARVVHSGKVAVLQGFYSLLPTLSETLACAKTLPAAAADTEALLQLDLPCALTTLQCQAIVAAGPFSR